MRSSQQLDARAKVVRNAFQMMDMLLIEHKYKEIHLQDKSTHGRFTGRQKPLLWKS